MNLTDARAKIPELKGLDDTQALNVLHQTFYPDMDKAELGKALGYTPPEPKSDQGDMSRGFEKAMRQIPQTAGGAAALVGDLVGSDGLKDYGLGVYNKQEEAIQKITKPSDSFSSVLEGEGSPIDFLQSGVGYVGGQALTALATGGAGGFIGAQLAKQGVKQAVARGVAEQVAAQAVKRGAIIGAGTAAGGSNLMQEAGSIYPEALQQAEKDGRTLDGMDKARIVGSSLAAAGVDTAMEGVMAGRLLHGGRKAGESMGRAALREVPLAMGREGATEGIQTGIERFGAGQDMTTADAIRDYVDSAALGALGGGLGGGASVLNAQKVSEAGPLTRAANVGIDEQILQLSHDPQPLISFPDGSVGHKQDLAAYLSQFTDPEERQAKEREIMGRDPKTGKKVEAEPAPEPTMADNEASSNANIKAWSAKHDPVPLDYAQALIAAPGAKGMDLMIAPHASGKGFTVVPSKWLSLDAQVRAGALQRGTEGVLPAPDMEAPAGAIRVDSEGGAAPETYAEQARTKATNQAAAKKRQELDVMVPRGAAAPSTQPEVATDAKLNDAADRVLGGTDGQVSGGRAADVPGVGGDAQPATDVRGSGTSVLPGQPSDAGAGGPSPQLILTAKGEPFKAKVAAINKQRALGTDSHDIVQVDGGWAVKPKKSVSANGSQIADENAKVEEPAAPADDGRVTRKSEIADGTTVKDEKGNLFRVHYQRNALVIAHPIVDGKPQVNADTTVRFWTDPSQTPAGENDRTDAIFPVKGGNPTTTTPPVAVVPQKPAKKPSTGAQVARDRLKASDPFLAFLAEHGVSSEDRADTSADASRAGNRMVPGYGPIFRKSGKRLDDLVTHAIEAGHLSQADVEDAKDNGGVNKLADMIQRAVQNREVILPAAKVDQVAEAQADDRATMELRDEANRLGIEGYQDMDGDALYDAVRAKHAEAIAAESESEHYLAEEDAAALDAAGISDEELNAMARVAANEQKVNDEELAAHHARESIRTAQEHDTGTQSKGDSGTQAAEGREGSGKAGNVQAAKPEAVEEKITRLLSEDNAEAAYQEFSKLKLPELKTVGYRFGFGTGHQSNKTQYLANIKERLHLLTASEQVKARHTQQLATIGDQYRKAEQFRDLAAGKMAAGGYNEAMRDDKMVAEYEKKMQDALAEFRTAQEQSGLPDRILKQYADVVDAMKAQPATDFGLTAESADEARIRIAAEEKAAKDATKAERDEKEADKAAQTKKEIAARQDASAENFQLGQSAEDGLSGQADLLGRGGSIDAIDPFDRTLLMDIATGKSTNDVLSRIADESANPQYRELAKSLMAANLKTTIEFGDSTGQKFAVKGIAASKFAAGYKPKADQVLLFNPRGAETSVLHELVHAATFKAIRSGGLAARQMTDLYRHVEQTGVMKGLYAMENLDEFVAEAFSNPQIQNLLRDITAMPQGSAFKNAWAKFVAIVRGILGLKNANALDQVMTAGAKLMEENKAIRASEQEALSGRATEQSGETVLGSVGAAYDMLKSAKTLGETTDTLKNMLLKSDRKFGLWQRSIGTQFDKASRDADFKRVFDAYNQQTDDTAHYAIEAERLAPGVLQRLDNFKDIGKALMNSGGQFKKDLEAASKALFANIEGKEGVQQKLFTDAELRSEFKLTDPQILMYRQVRAAVDTSIDRLAQTTIASMGEAAGMDISALKNLSAAETAKAVIDATDTGHIGKDIGGNTRNEDLHDKIRDLLDRTDELKAKAYMPAMRFGEYAVTVRDAAGSEPIHFEMFESQTAANIAAMKLAKEYPGKTVDKSVLNPDAYAMFKGVSPETVELFAKFSGMDQNEAYKDYIALAKSSRSTLQRLQNRKGTAGFSEDATRVLASFLTSNARQSAMNMNAGEINAAMASPTLARKGDVQREAQKLHEYMANPREEAQKLRGFLFMHFIGGSIASSITNLTQPILQTTPYLAQYAGGKTAGIMAAAAKQAATGKIENAELRAAMERAKADGVVDAHEIHMLMADASGATLGTSLRARALTKAWGSFFSLSEAYNRRLTFLAAYQTAMNMGPEKLEAKGFKDAYAFAQRAIIETQGLYSKTNRPNWARGAVGATLFTFKQFSISYIEFFNRLPNKQKALALGILILAAGVQGVPFADDLEDLIDTLGQTMGYNVNSKKWLRDKLLEVFGDYLGEILANGISQKTGIDMSGRLGMGNLIPGTGLLKMSEPDKSRDVAEMAGALGGVLSSFQKSFGRVQAGDYAGAAREMAPTAIKNALQGADMATTGSYKDGKGRKVRDVDMVDAIVKGLGFQPQQIASETRKISDMMQDKGMRDAVKHSITDRLVNATFDGDQAGVAKARQVLQEWNTNNEDRITISPVTIRQRLVAMRQSREQRFLKTVPKALRAQAREDLQE